MNATEKPVEPGERRQYLVAASGRPDLPPPSYVGDKTKRGAAYLFEFPFVIHVDGSASAEPEVSYRESTEIRIYPPFLAHGQAVDRRIEPEQIPHPKGTLPPNHDKVGMKSLSVNYGLGEPRDALRIDVVPDRGAAFATRYAEQLCKYTQIPAVCEQANSRTRVVRV